MMEITSGILNNSYSHSFINLLDYKEGLGCTTSQGIWFDRNIKKTPMLQIGAFYPKTLD